MPRFTDRMLPEIVQPFWAALQRGEVIVDAAAQVGTYRKKGSRWVAAHGGVRPRRGRNLKGRCLTFGEREEIALARARGESLRTIAQRLGRAPSTISRELRRNRDQCGYRATTAHALAYGRASRPKPAKLASNLALRAKVEQDLTRRYSPEQIAGRLRVEFTTPGRVHEALADFEGWNPVVRRLISAVRDPSAEAEVYRWALYDRDPLPGWGVGPVTLLGDAAHPMLPFMGQGACQAIEDGAVLAACLRVIDEPVRALRQYEDLRRERTATVQLAARRNETMFHLPDGPDQRARDEQLAATSGERTVHR